MTDGLQQSPPTNRCAHSKKSGRGQPHSKTLRNDGALRSPRQRLGVRLSSAAFIPVWCCHQKPRPARSSLVSCSCRFLPDFFLFAPLAMLFLIFLPLLFLMSATEALSAAEFKAAAPVSTPDAASAPAIDGRPSPAAVSRFDTSTPAAPGTESAPQAAESPPA